ncbi:hypothetical protein QUB52_24240, partial [Microcoleus sp. A6-C6]|uniref:hypothetical protein n=1 Tax=unclassified Microcoleus TaxID=2642155 RepID=UPI002FCF6CFD
SSLFGNFTSFFILTLFWHTRQSEMHPNQKLLLEKMGQQQQQFIRQGKLEQENPKLLLENMDKQQKELIRLGLLTIFIVSVSVLLISLIK